MKSNTEHFAVVMIGAPGSGKSTFAHNLMKQNNFTYVNYDSIRKHLWGDENIQGSWKEISKTVDVLTFEANHNNSNIIVDGCHHRGFYRKEVCSKLRKNGYSKVIGVFVNSSLENCLKQNSSRSRQVPGNVIEKIWKQLEENKGKLLTFFDELITYNPETNATSTFINSNKIWKLKQE